MTQQRQLTGDGGAPIPPPSLDDVLLERREGYAIVTLNRPVVLNAINWSILRRLKWALDEAEADASVKAVILTGAGRAFCAGGDLQSRPPDDGLTTPPASDIYMKIWSMPKPVIAAVRGYAVGQGVELAGICDLTVAEESAQFGEIQIRHGFGPPVLITPFTTPGHKQAKELLLLGEQYDAREAQRLGLVNWVVPDGTLIEEAEKVARKLASLSERTVRQNKVVVNRAYELAGFREALNYRNDPAVRALAQGGVDQSEHIRVLREQGWEAFRTSRDKLYRED